MRRALIVGSIGFALLAWSNTSLAWPDLTLSPEQVLAAFADAQRSGRRDMIRGGMNELFRYQLKDGRRIVLTQRPSYTLGPTFEAHARGEFVPIYGYARVGDDVVYALADMQRPAAGRLYAASGSFGSPDTLAKLSLPQQRLQAIRDRAPRLT